MIERLHLVNFKAFHEVDIEFSPITVIAGPNSSGKSSIIQALLLLRQTLEGPRRHRLSLNGDYLNYSEYREIAFGKKEGSQVTIEIEYNVPILSDIVTDERLQQCFTQNEIAVIRESTPQFHSSISITFSSRGEKVNVVEMRVKSEYGTLRNQPLILELAFEEGTYRGRLSNMLIGRGKDLQEDEDARLIETISFVDVDQWHFFFPRRINMAMEVGDEPDLRTIEYLDLIGISMLSSEIIEKMHYIGPLRSEPKRAYATQGNRVELDFRGENTLQVLLDEKDSDVMYIEKNQDTAKLTNLVDAVNAVLVDVLELSQRIEPISLSGIFAQLMLPFSSAQDNDDINRDEPSQYVTIADVGFGVSQVLPIIVAGLRAGADEILIVEQPEAHLHPRVQSNLADFFVLLARLGKRVIVETHSEHLINGFREAIARDINSMLDLHNKLQVVFVSQSMFDGAGANIKSLIFDEYGYGMEWPSEFLPRSAVESRELLRLISDKRKYVLGKSI